MNVPEDKVMKAIIGSRVLNAITTKPGGSVAEMTEDFGWSSKEAIVGEGLCEYFDWHGISRAYEVTCHMHHLCPNIDICTLRACSE